MSDLDYMNLSTDLRRIALWLQGDEVYVAGKFIEINRRRFGDDEYEIGKRKISGWVSRIGDFEVRGGRSVEDALTLSILLKSRFSTEV